MTSTDNTVPSAPEGISVVDASGMHFWMTRLYENIGNALQIMATMNAVAHIEDGIGSMPPELRNALSDRHTTLTMTVLSLFAELYNAEFLNTIAKSFEPVEGSQWEDEDRAQVEAARTLISAYLTYADAGKAVHTSIHAYDKKEEQEVKEEGSDG